MREESRLTPRFRICTQYRYLTIQSFLSFKEVNSSKWRKAQRKWRESCGNLEVTNDIQRSDGGIGLMCYQSKWMVIAVGGCFSSSPCHEGICTGKCKLAAHRSKLCPHPSQKAPHGHSSGREVHAPAAARSGSGDSPRSSQALGEGLGSVRQRIPESWIPG